MQVLPKIFSHRAALLKLSQHLGKECVFFFAVRAWFFGEAVDSDSVCIGLVRLASDQTSASITGGNGADDGWTDAINQPSDTADPLTAAAVFSGSGWVQVQHDDLRTEAGEERVSPGTVCDVRTFRESVAQLVKVGGGNVDALIRKCSALVVTLCVCCRARSWTRCHQRHTPRRWTITPYTGHRWCGHHCGRYCWGLLKFGRVFELCLCCRLFEVWH